MNAEVFGSGETLVRCPAGVAWVSKQLDAAVERLRNGGVRSPLAEEIAAAFREGTRRAASAVGRTEVPPLVEVQVSLVEPIGVAEAMEILDTSDSYVRHLCRNVFASARRLNGGHGPWQMEGEEVREWAKKGAAGQ